MKNILVIADPAENEQLAFAKALSMAKTTVANIYVVIFCHPDSHAVTDKEDTEAGDEQQITIDNATQWWASYLDSNSVTTPATYEAVWEQHIHEWVLEHCQHKHYDLIIKTGHRSESLFHTPTDWQLFRKSSVPVYCVTPDPQETNNIVLVALDLMTVDDAKQQLNQRLLEAAFQLSLQTDCELHCCYAMETPVMLTDVELMNTPVIMEEVAQKTKIKMAALTKNYDIDEKNIHIEQGGTCEILTKLGDDLKVNCFVLGTTGRTGIAGKLIGNTAEKVIHQANKDLLVLSAEESES